MNGNRMTRPTVAGSYSRLSHGLAIATLASTLTLIFVGALVTSYDVGMAVPDYPTTMGKSMWGYDFRGASWGIFLEHSHRLIATGVGFVTLLLAGALLWLEPRRSVRWLGLGALGLVLAQGLLGGIRVIYNEIAGREFAAFHGAVAQAFIFVVVSLVLFTSRGWMERIPAVATSLATGLRRAAWSLTALIYAQIIVGAILRHIGWGFVLHLAMVVALVAVTLWLVLVSLTHPDVALRLGRPARSLAVAFLGQLLLGVAAWLLHGIDPPGLQTITDTGAFAASLHVLLGSILFATSISMSWIVQETVVPLPQDADRSRGPALKTPAMVVATQPEPVGV